MEYTYRDRYPMSACDAPTNDPRSAYEGPVATDAPAPIDWHKEMRTCVGDAAELADRITTSDSDVGGALARLCNVVAHLLDENNKLTALAEHQFAVNSQFISIIHELTQNTSSRLSALDRRVDAIEGEPN